MAIPSRQIGWSTKANLLWQISKQLEQLIKVSAPNKIRDLIALFKLRVGFNDGAFEAEACLDATLTNLDNIDLLDKASLIITPNAYNPGVLYDVVPNNNLGDMNVVRVTTATRVNSAGLIEEVGLNIPRLDYSNGSCPSLLVEPQRTNLISSSNNFTNWVNGGVTLTSNYATSPDGTLNATRYQGISGLYLFNSYASTTNLTHSVYIKSNTGINQNIAFGGQTVSIFVVTNEWKRIDKSIIASEALTQITTVQTTDILIWGAQAEQGSYPTSYIPTVASTVTRNADIISKTGISSLIGQTEGTLFIDFYNQLINSTILFLNKNSSNSIAITTNPTGIQCFFICNSIQFQLLVSGYTVKNQKLKVAISYNSLGYKLFVNGILKGTNTNSIIFTAPLTSVNLNDDIVINLNQTIYNNGAQLYKTALSDTECIALTTL